MKLRDFICPFFFIAICAALFFKWKDEKWDRVPSDPGKAERDSLRQVAREKESEAKAWMDSAAYYRKQFDSLSAIPPSVIIDDAVRLTRNASIDSVRAILLARPE